MQNLKKNWLEEFGNFFFEWCKIWNRTVLPFQNWHEKFNKFWPEHSKISKICSLMCWFWPKYIMLQLKKVQSSYVWLHSRLTQSLKENWLVLPKIVMRNLANFEQSTWKSSNWDLGGILMSLKFKGELCVMTMKNDAKAEEELTCQFKIDMKNLTNFNPSSRKSKKFALQSLMKKWTDINRRLTNPANWCLTNVWPILTDTISYSTYSVLVILNQ